MFRIATFVVTICCGLALSCENGSYSPHPNDCSKFLMCSNGVPVEGSCNAGLHWNAKGKYCDYPANAGCTSDGGGQTTTQMPWTNPPPTTNKGPITTGSSGVVGKSRTGICSWYGAEGEIPPGWPTSCGQPFDRNAMAAATWPEVPCGTKLRVIDLDTGKSVEVIVDDRFGGAPQERIVDLTYGAFAYLANHDQGLIQNCRYEVIE